MIARAVFLALLAASPCTAEEAWAVHGQMTGVLQGTPGFDSPYEGANSLTPHQRKETLDATLFVGVRGWRGLEVWADPEVDQGFGLSNTLGAAGFPSAEAYKVGKKHPYLRLQRLFARQTIDLGGAREEVEGEANVLGGSRAGDRLVLTVGKFGVGDVFDTNKYAHDPRGDFLNWTVVDAGSFDYAADAWGYSLGAAAEWYQGDWTWRVGLMNLSKIPNGETLETGFSQRQLLGEIEHRHAGGAIRLTAFSSSGRLGAFADALALARATGTTPDTNLVQRRRSRSGVSLGAEQALTEIIGAFLRAGIADGDVAPYDFTDVDRSLSAGLSIGGTGWGRSGDTLGIAGVVNAISARHRAYLAAGGLGVLVGDGQLPHYGAELIGEAYYSLAVGKPLSVSLDYQLVARPAYNRDRGPANVFALRLHGQF